MSTRAPYLVIWNPQASQAAQAEALRLELERDEQFHICETSSPDDASLLAREASGDDRIELVVAAGGDGTVNSVINGLCHEGCRNAGVPLAIIPIGTANDLCRSLEIPLDPFQFRSLIERRRLRKIDLAQVEAPGTVRLFANMAAGGNSNRVSEYLTDEMKQKWGAWCYLRGAIDVLRDLNGYKLSMQCDDGPTETLSAWNFIIANNRSIGGITVAPLAKPSDGYLDLIVIEDGTTLDLAQVVLGVVSQTYLEHESVVHRRVRRVTIETDPHAPAMADGEAIEGQPLTFSVVPAALDVVVGDYTQ
ncbi:MAG: diacylglycerol kinase family lipid kinase [Planctomycetota bacterium]|nr:MAG: diacylglycerol kinase family lipid kinase [Planctomycetota bacterium]